MVLVIFGVLFVLLFVLLVVVLLLGMLFLACREVKQQLCNLVFFFALGGFVASCRLHSKAIIPSAINIGVFLVVPINVH